jgi:hypothetical protein
MPILCYIDSLFAREVVRVLQLSSVTDIERRMMLIAVSE